MRGYGLSEKEIREVLERELGKNEASTSFYWESDELDEVLDLVMDAVSKAIAANNNKIAQDWKRRGLSDLDIGSI